MPDHTEDETSALEFAALALTDHPSWNLFEEQVSNLYGQAQTLLFELPPDSDPGEVQRLIGNMQALSNLIELPKAVAAGSLRKQKRKSAPYVNPHQENE